mmetsp:Transcript_23292/g.40285  ORF Transcript_23292/g.40285 Transcript_23292/m.40285 type:complete len:288 (+) Transcript_23292:763-1626(+)
MIRLWRGRGDGAPFDAQRGPGRAGACRAQVRPAVLFRAADDGRRNFVRLVGPSIRPGPTASAHQVAQRLAHGGGIVRVRLRPVKKFGSRMFHGNNYNARTQLRHPIIGRIQQPPIRPVAQRIQLRLEPFAIVMKHSTQKAAHVLDHHGAGAGGVNDVDGIVEQVPLVLFAQLLARDGKGRAGQPTGQEVHAAIVGRTLLKDPQVFFEHVPMWAIVAQCVAAMRVDLDQCAVAKARLFQPKGLTARACAKFDRCQHMPALSLVLGTRRPSDEVGQGSGSLCSLSVLNA